MGAKGRSQLEESADEQWRALPDRLRIEQRPPNHATPFERDFLFSICLNHLHVKLLLRRLSLAHQSEPDGAVVEIAQKMLSLVVDVVLTRDELANSGTNLSWKVSHLAIVPLLVMLNNCQGCSLRATRSWHGTPRNGKPAGSPGLGCDTCKATTRSHRTGRRN